MSGASTPDLEELVNRAEKLLDTPLRLASPGDLDAVANTVAPASVNYPLYRDVLGALERRKRGSPNGKVSDIRVKPAWRLVDPSTVEPRAIEWLWEHRVPTGTLTILAGPGGIGKGALWVDLAGRVSRGLLPGDLAGSPAGVMILTAEERIADVVRPRLEAAGADLSMVRVLTMKDGEYDRDATFPDDLEALREALAEHRARFIVIDPLNAHIADRIDSHKDAPLRRALGPLTRLTGDTGAAILAVAHTNKGTGDAVNRILGSVAYVNAARSVLIVGRPPDGEDGPERIVAMPKANNSQPVPSLRFRLEGRLVDGLLADGEWGKVDTVGMVWLGEDSATAEDLLGSSEDRTATAEAREWLEDFLDDGRRPKTEITAEARKHGITEKPLRRAREALRIVVERDDSQKGRPSIWSLPRLRALSDEQNNGSRNRANEYMENPDYVPTQVQGTYSPGPGSSSPRPPCTFCGLRLDPALTDRTTHPNCEPTPPGTAPDIDTATKTVADLPGAVPVDAIPCPECLHPTPGMHFKGCGFYDAETDLIAP